MEITGGDLRIDLINCQWTALVVIAANENKKWLASLAFGFHGLSLRKCTSI